MAVDFSELAFGFVLKEVKDKNFLYRMLAGVQRDVDTMKSKENAIKLYEEGCLKEVIEELRCSKDLDNLELNLGIIGMCSSKTVCAEQMITKFDLLAHLSYVLSTHHQDKIQRRVFRIIRNLCCCQQQDFLICSSENKMLSFTDAIIDRESEFHFIDKIMRYLETVGAHDEHFLANNTRFRHKRLSEATSVIAVQIIRTLAENPCMVPFVKSHQIMKVLGLLLIRFTFLWQSTKNYERIILNILHTIFILLHYDPYNTVCAKFDMVLELQNTRNGNSLECLGKLMSLSPHMVVKIAVYIIDLKIESANVPVESILKECIKKLDTPSSFQRGREDCEHEDYIKYVFVLVSACQNENLAVSILPTINRVLKDYSKPTEIALKNCACIISLLWQTQSRSFLIKYGIVDTVLEKLDLILGADIDVDTYHAIKKCHWGYSLLHCRVLFSQNCYLVDSSESVEDMELSSSSSYSSYYSSLNSEGDDDVLYDCGSLPFVCLKKQLSRQIINFIKPFLCIPSVTKKIISSDVLTKLLMFLLPMYYPLCSEDIIKVILSITQNPKYYLEIMQTDFIVAAHEFVQRLHTTICKTCKTLEKIHKYVLNVSEDFVEQLEGPLRGVLDKANYPIKQKLACAIPYLTNKKQSLSYLMLSCRALNVIVEFLKKNVYNEDLNIQLRCVDALHTLAKQLGIQSYVCDNVNIDLNFSTSNRQNETVKKYSVVRFKMDDGTCIEEDRNFLSEKSEYFSTLLSGNFKESAQEEIHLHNVSRKSFEVLMMFLHCNIANEEYPVLAMTDVELDVLLDVLSLTNRYVLENLCSYLIKSGLWNLKLIFTYVLAGKMTKSERFELFKKLLQLEYSDYFVKDIQKLLTSYLF